MSKWKTQEPDPEIMEKVQEACHVPEEVIKEITDLRMRHNQEISDKIKDVNMGQSLVLIDKISQCDASLMASFIAALPRDDFRNSAVVTANRRFGIMLDVMVGEYLRVGVLNNDDS